MEIEKFRILDKDKKIHYLLQIILPIIKTEKDMQTLEIFLFWSTDEELADFYEVVLDPEKIAWCMSKHGESLNKWINELNQINQLLISAKVEMVEGIEGQDADKLIQNL